MPVRASAITLPLLGGFNVSNALAAAATARAAGFAARRRRAPGCRPPARCPVGSSAIDAGQPFTVLVDYAHSPGALTAVLAAARELAGATGG